MLYGMESREGQGMFPIQDTSDVDSAFGGRMSDLLPPYQDIPDSFKGFRRDGYCGLVSDWFFNGLKWIDLVTRPGVDENKALRHIRAILSSFEPAHEHKEAGIAFLMNEWFESASWATAKGPEAGQEKSAKGTVAEAEPAR